MRWPLLSRLGQDVRLTTGSVVRSMCDVEVWMRDVAGDGVVGREVRATERLRVLWVGAPRTRAGTSLPKRGGPIERALVCLRDAERYEFTFR